MNGGLKHAAATFAVHLVDSIKREADARLAKVLGEALFGKSDEFGSDGGLLGKLLDRVGLGGLFGGKGKGGSGDPAATVTSTIERTAQETQARLDTTNQDNTVNRDWNTDRTSTRCANSTRRWSLSGRGSRASGAGSLAPPPADS